MKRSIKIALVLILLGIIMIFGAIAAGAQINENFFNSISLKSEVKNQSFPAIQEVNIEVKGYSVEIVPSGDTDITEAEYTETSSFGNTKSTLRFELKDGVLHVKEESTEKVKLNFNIGIFNGFSGEKKLVLSVPEKISGKVTQEFGSFEAVNLNLEDFTVKTQMGSIDLIQVKAVNSKLESEMGSFDVEDSICENIKLETEMGSIKYSGKLLGNNEFSTEMGSIDLKLEQKRNDISLNLRTEMGDIEVDDVKGKIVEEKDPMKGYLKADTEMGSIDVKFKD